jgi:uncharacterized protein YfbU (UPF0304 family)
MKFEWIGESMSTGLSSEECAEVIEILEMYSDIQRGFDVLDDKSGIRENRTNFPGFYGNQELNQVCYCRYLCDERGRFQSLRRVKEDWNWDSHWPMLEAYRRMLAVWRPIREAMPQRKRRLSRREMLDILYSALDPELLRGMEPQGSVQ